MQLLWRATCYCAYDDIHLVKQHFARHEAAMTGSMGEHHVATSKREELGDKLEAVDGSCSAESELKLLWDTAILCRESPQEQGLDVDEVEDLVLAHLLVFPEFLQDALVMNLFRQVQLGQSFLHSEEQHINVAAVLEQMKPRLEAHKAIAAQIAKECCDHLQTHSESLALKLLKQMDLDCDGFVCEEEFLKTMVHAIAVEVENMAVSVGVQQLLKEERFADDFHQADTCKLPEADKDLPGDRAHYASKNRALGSLQTSIYSLPVEALQVKS
eukprot:symbB.v1.2.013069.t1/scaffold907.1/size153227/14